MRSIIYGALMALSIAAAGAGEVDDKACVRAAVEDYFKADMALTAQTGMNLTVEAKIAKRRLEESFCLRVAGCLAGPNQPWVAKVPPNMAKLALAAEFGRCLDDEAEENLKNRVK